MMHSDREHVDSDQLALMAMGEPGIPDADVRHVASCPECAAEVRELSRIVELGRSSGDYHGSLPDVTAHDVMPRDEVWTGISAALGLSAGVVPASFGGGSAARATTAGSSARPTTGTRDAPPAPKLHAIPAHTAPPQAHVAPTQALHAVPSDTTPHAARPAGSGTGAEERARRRWLPPLLGAAAIVLIVGGIAGGLALQQPPPAEVLAEAQLDALPEWNGASGQAVVEVDGDGGRSVVVALQDGVPDDGYREVWLISNDLTSLVSIGVLEGDEARFVIPAGIDLEAFPIVDVSDEPLDGDPAHSGNSIVRGTLES